MGFGTALASRGCSVGASGDRGAVVSDFGKSIFPMVFSMNVALWLAVSMTAYISGSQDVVLRDSVDLVEVNHYHDARGQHVFDQLIFYDWSSQKRRFQVRAWRLIKSENQVPRRDHRSGNWLVRWHDDGVMREVTATSRRETWTQYDPELVQRDNLPQEQRLDLSSRQSTAEKWAAIERALPSLRSEETAAIGAE